MGNRFLGFVEKHYEWVLFALGTLMAVSPAIIRWYVYGIPGIIGFPTYYHKRIAEYILSGNFGWYDPLSFGGRAFTYPPLFPFFLAFAGIFGGVDAGGTVFMGILGGTAAVIFYLITRELSGNEKVSSIVLVFSPGFVYLFSHFCSRSPPIVMGLAALYLTIRKEKWYYRGALLGITSLFHWETFLFFSLVIFLYEHKEKNVWRAFAMGLAIAAVWYLPFLFSNGLPGYNSLHSDYVSKGYGLEPFDMKMFARELGGNYDNVALLTLLLSFAGLFVVENKFYKRWFLLCIALALLTNRLLLYMVFPSSVLASLVIAKFRNKIRGLAIPLFVGYVVIVGTLSVAQFAGFYPLKEEYEAMQWIGHNTPENATVFSHWGHGHWITGIAHRKSFMDGYAEYPPMDIERRMRDYENFFKTCRIPEGYGIGYVFIEQWIVDEYNMTCIASFGKPVYNESWIFVFDVRNVTS